MSGRSFIMLLVLVALVFTLSLVAAVASNASAQVNTNPDTGQGSWVRHNVPTTQDWQTTTNPNFPVADPRYCCITLTPGGTVDTSIGTADTSVLDGWERWFCIGGYYQNNFY